jgi:imidazole glycerol-phosphate synthase subunit HisF
MLTKRIIACLDVMGGRVVKGVRFEQLRDAGDPAELAAAHAEAGADEVVLLDISATHEKRSTLAETVQRTAKRLFIPFTVGGGIRSLDEAMSVFDAGADKISINSAALADPSLIAAIAGRYGSQAVIVAIDAKRANAEQRGARQSKSEQRSRGQSGPAQSRDDKSEARSDDQSGGEMKYQAFVSGGRRATGRDAVAWAREAELRGAGEILLTSMDRDGTGAGFDCELTRAVSDAVRIPVIASGGGGDTGSFVDVFQRGRADAALAASIFHFGLRHLGDLKRELRDAGIPMRWPC